MHVVHFVVCVEFDMSFSVFLFVITKTVFFVSHFKF
jgi:hypothetical protein